MTWPRRHLGRPPARARARVCGSFRGAGSDPVGVVIERGGPSCATAKKVLRTYLRSHAPCTGSACVRKHCGWTCARVKAPDWPRLASCNKGKSRIAAEAPAD